MFLMAGCSSAETVCPAIGYSSTLNIHFTGDTERVAEVIVCSGPECRGEDAFQQSMQSGYAVQAMSDEGAWTATLFFPEDPLTVRVTDSAGEVLLETRVQPDWVRTGGSEECGGPAEAEVVFEL